MQKIAPGAPNPRDSAIERRSVEISSLLHRRWTDSLLAVERVTNKNITILEFHPDFGNEKLVLRGEAREFDALADYIKQLNATGLVKNVALMHEQAISREHVDTIEFELKGDL
ncbi:PilN domain-containing protein [Solimicrobium silvestre]|uniref:Fimbrial assembly protein (PilN) n=1 Tax=Solimicrobium silvestre TaxID=2099400 RepID=A0A2S9H0F5_9BURK|nr:PilN domain-containing protein [Solimicrobium silvestre]PRC93462.1 Fimbrial assembly protein (PilN) [Solimicrobium silvestre]